MEVDLHVTNRCNLRCQHCVYQSGTWKMDDMTLDTIYDLIPSLQRMQVKEIHITGGEPLLNQQIYAIISLLHNAGFIIKMQSNGMILDQKKAMKIKKLGVSQILISIDGMSLSHNVFRNHSSSFDAAIQAIKTCLYCGIPTRVNSVLHRDNIKDIENLINLTSQIGVNHHSFFYLTPIGRGKNLKEKYLSFSEWKEICGIIIELAQKIHFQDKIKIQDVFHEAGESIENICRRDNCLIMSNGDVYSCVFFVGSKYRMGNILNQTLWDIWENSTIWHLLSAPRKKRCSRLCGGGCPGLTYLITGTIDRCNPQCCPESNLISSCIRKYAKSR